MELIIYFLSILYRTCQLKNEEAFLLITYVLMFTSLITRFQQKNGHSQKLVIPSMDPRFSGHGSRSFYFFITVFLTNNLPLNLHRVV